MGLHSWLSIPLIGWKLMAAKEISIILTLKTTQNKLNIKLTNKPIISSEEADVIKNNIRRALSYLFKPYSH